MNQIPSTADPRQGLRDAYRQYMAQRPATAGTAAAPQEDPRRAQLREAYRQYQAQKSAPAAPIAEPAAAPDESPLSNWAVTAARLSNPATRPGAVGDLASRFATGAFSGVLQQGGQAARLGQALTSLPRVFNHGVGAAGAAVAGGVSELADNPAGILNGGFTRGAARGLEAVQGSMPQAGPIESTLRAGAGQVAAPLEAASAAAEGIQTPPKQYTPEWFADMAGRSTPVMVASIAGEMAAGPAGAMLPVFATEGGQVASDIFHDRISQGASEEQALEDAAVPAVITGLFNAGVEMAGVQHLVHAGIVRGEARKWAKEWLASTVSEGLEEVVQNEAQAQTRQAVTGVGPGGTFMDRAVPSFVGGAGLGAAMGGPVALGGVASEGKGLRPAAGPPAPGRPGVAPAAPPGAPAAAPTVETPPAPGTPAAPPASVNAAIDALNAQVAAAKAANAERARAAQADQDALARIQQALATPAAEAPAGSRQPWEMSPQDHAAYIAQQEGFNLSDVTGFTESGHPTVKKGSPAAKTVATARRSIKDGIEARGKINAALFDGYNKLSDHPLSLPEGYVREGDYYEVPQTQAAKLEGAMARRRAAPPLSIDQDAENQDILDEAIGGVRRGIQDRTTRQETADAEVQQAAPGRGSERGQPGQAEGQGLPAQEGWQGLEQEGQGGPDRALHGQPGPAVEARPGTQAEGAEAIPFVQERPPANDVEAKVDAEFTDAFRSREHADQLYAKIPDSLGGKVVGTDIARELSPTYANTKEDRFEATKRTTTPARIYADELLQRRIENPPERADGKAPKVVVMAGGVASGKSTVANSPIFKPEIDDADLVVDTQLKKFPDAKAKIDMALAHGWDVHIMYVQRPFKLAVRGQIERAIEQGRWGHTRELPDIHMSVQDTITKLREHYADNKLVKIAGVRTLGTKEDPIRPHKFGLARVAEKGDLRYASKADLVRETEEVIHDVRGAERHQSEWAQRVIERSAPAQEGAAAPDSRGNGSGVGAAHYRRHPGTGRPQQGQAGEGGRLAASIEATSRSSGGESNTSTSEKKRPLRLTGEALSAKVRENVALAQEYIDRVAGGPKPESYGEVMEHITALADAINDGLLPQGAGRYREWDIKGKLPADQVQKATRDLAREIYSRWDEIQKDPVPLAARVEWELNGGKIHPFYDGAGRTSKAVGALILAWGNARTPVYNDKAAYFAAGNAGPEAFEKYMRERIAAPKEEARGVLDQGQAPGGVPEGAGQTEKSDGARAPTGPESSAPPGEPAPNKDLNQRPFTSESAAATFAAQHPGATIEPTTIRQQNHATGKMEDAPAWVVRWPKKGGVSSKQENTRGSGSSSTRGGRGKRAEPGPGVNGTKALGEAPPAADGQAEGGGDVRADDQGPGGAGGKVSEPDRPAAGDRPDGGEEHGPPGVDLRQPAGPRRAPGINYRITPDDRIGVGGFSPKGRYRANIAAIKLLKELEAAGRKATPEEQKVLVQYVGWGGLPQVFGEVPAAYEEGDAPAGADETKPGEWDAEARELKKLLTDDEWKAARASTPNAHFTSAEVISAMWDGLKRLGFQGGRIVEPAVGAGHFFGLMPQDIAANSDLRAVERDSLSARITAQLYQQADVKHASFQDVRTPDNSADLYISNVPFANVAVYDKYDRALTAKRLSLHNYFFAKAMKAVRPGGLVAFITTHYTLDTLNSNFRRDMAAQANLVGAVRLPFTAFKGIANTSVVTDIIILQKRGPGIDKAGPDFVRTEPVELKGNDGSVHPHNVNEYFLERKDKVIGRQAATGTMRAKFGYNVEPKTTVKLGPAIAEAIASMTDVNKAALAWTPEQTIRQEKASIDAAGSLTPDGGLALQEGKVYIRRGDELELIPTPGNAKTAFAKHVAAFIPLRDAIRELRAAEKNPDIPDEHLDRLRAALNERYDEFVSKLGPVNRKASWYAEDNDSPLVMALEVYDAEKDTAKKADVFRQRVIWPAKVIDKADSPEAAVRASLDQYGHLDLEHIANLMGITPDKAREALGTRVFENPQGGLELAEFYLAGDVVDKLNAAREAAAEDPRYKANVAALEAVQPKPVPAEQIGVSPGVNWIPPDVYQDFLREQLRIGANVRYSPELNKWVIGTVKDRAKTLENESVHGTPDFFGHELFEAAMNNTVKTVRFSEAEGGEVNPQATAAARIKQQDLVDRFRTWLWEDGERTARIEGIYNDRFNRTVAPVFDGSHLTLPGSFLPDGRQLHAHVKDAIWRIVSTGNTLLAHAVGAGKTWAMVGAAMEMRRLGIAKKPIIVAPNHVYAQFAREWLQLYPGAKLLVAQTDDFTPAKRRTLMARISTGDWDGVVVPMTSFEKLALSPPLVMEFVQKQINELEEAIRQEKAGKDNGRSLVKELEKAKDRLAGKLAELQAEWKKDPGPYFDDLGIDAMFVDEAHNYKNLWFASRMGRVPGVVPGDAQRAFDMYVKSQYLTRRTGGRSVVLATGTPISNSVTEMFTMIRFLAEQALERRGIQKFDQWAHTFGELVSDVEVTPEGGGLRENSRFVKFKNMPELSQIFRQFADVILPEDLKVKRPAINTGGAQGVQIQPAPGLDAFVQGLVARAARIRSGAVDPSEDNMLKITGEGKKAALDMRLVDPDAPDLPNSKLATCAAKVHDIWEKTKATKGTQIIWCDLGTPTGKRGKGGAPAILNDQMSAEERMAALEEAASQGSLNVYEDLTKKLVAKGIPRTQIAWIHDAKDEAAKARMFERFRLGQLRVILASTQKMGTGANVQDRIVAMHHLDAPWRPADIEQRDGRGYRQGNTNASIDIFRYIAKDSFDAYLWQLLEIKSKFIHAAMKGEGGMREIGGDIGSQALEYSELKALAAKDPRIVEVTRLQNQVQKLAALEASHAAQLGRLKQTISRLPAKIEWSEKSLAARRAAVKLLEPLAEAFSKAKAGEMPPLTMMGKTYTDREEAKAALTNAAVGDAVFEKPESFEDAGTTSVRKVGAMGPISIIGKLNKKYGLGLVLEAAGVRVSTNNLDADGAHNLRLILDAVRSLYKGEMIPHDEASIKADTDELGKARERLEQIKVFPRAAEYAEKRAKLAELRRELDVNNRPDDKVPGAEDVPSLPPLKRRSEVEKRAFTLLEDVTGRPVGEYTVHPLFLREAKKGEVQRPLPHDQQRKLIDKATAAVRKATGNAQVEWSDDEGRFQYPEVRRVGYKQITEWRPVPQKTWHPIVKDIADDAKGVEAVVEGIPYWGYHMPAGAPVEAEHVAAAMEQAQQQITSEAQAKRTGKLFVQPDLVARLEARGREHLAMAREAMSGGPPSGAYSTPGARSGHAVNIFDAALHLATAAAYQAAAKAVKGGAALTRIVRETIAEFTGGHIPVSQVDVRRMATAILKEATSTGKFNQAAFDQAVDDMRLAGTGHATTHPGKVAKAVYERARKDASQEARQELEDLTEKSRRMAVMERYERRAAVQGAKLEAKDNAQQVKAYQERAVYWANRLLPTKERGKVLAAVVAARNPARLYGAMNRMTRVLARHEAREMWRSVLKLTKPKLTRKLTIPRLEVANAIKLAAALAWAGVKQKGLTNHQVSELALELRRHAENLATLYHEQREERKAWGSAFMAKVGTLREAVIERLERKREIRSRGPIAGGVRTATTLPRRVYDRSLNIDVISQALDHDWDRAGPMAGTVRALEDAEWDYLALRKKLADLAEGIFKKHGYKSTADFEAKTAGTLGFNAVKTLDIRLGGYAKMPMGVALSLAAADPRARAYWTSEKKGVLGSWRFDPTNRAFPVPASVLDAVDQDPDVAKHEAMIEDFKGLFGKLFREAHPVVLRLTGKAAPPVGDAYWPMPRNQELRAGDDVPPGIREMRHHLEDAGFMKPRSGGSSPLIIDDFSTTVNRHLDSIARIIAMSEAVRLASGVWLSPDVKQELTARYGSQMVDDLRMVLDEFVGSGPRVHKGAGALLVGISRNVTAAMTQLNKNTMARQLFGVFRLIPEMGLERWAKGMAGALGRGVGDQVRNSPWFWARYSTAPYHQFSSIDGDVSEASGGQSWRALQALGAESVRKLAGKQADVSRPWAAFRDSIRVGNVFDAIPARVAWAGYAGHPQQAKMATRAFRRTQNTTGALDSGMWMVEGRSSPALGMWLSLTSDANKQFNVLNRYTRRVMADPSAAHVRDLAYAVTGMSLNVLGSAAIRFWWAPAMWLLGAALGGHNDRDKRRRDAQAAAWTAAQEAAGAIIPGSGRVIEIAQGVTAPWQQGGGTDTPFGSNLSQAVNGLQGMARDIIAHPHRFQRDPAFWLSASRLVKALGSAAGAPTPIISELEQFLRGFNGHK